MVFKACPRCRGDLFREEDIGQTDLVCLQCGFRRPFELVPVMGRPTGGTRSASIRAQRPVRFAA